MTSTSLPELDAFFQPALSGKLKKHKRKHRGKPVCREFENLRTRRTRYVHTGTGLRICWIWSTTRNKEGYFIGCREVLDKDRGVGFRDSFRQRKARWRVSNWCLDQFNESPWNKTGWKYALKT